MKILRPLCKLFGHTRKLIPMAKKGGPIAYCKVCGKQFHAGE